MTFGDVLSTFTAYCQGVYGSDMDISKWAEYCEETKIARHVERTISNAFQDEALFLETQKFASMIGKLALDSNIA